MNVYEWSNGAPVGAHIVYHRGPYGTLPKYKLDPAMEAHRQGLVFLAQRKRPSGMVEYHAVRISFRTAAFLGLVKMGGVTPLGELLRPRVLCA